MAKQKIKTCLYIINHTPIKENIIKVQEKAMACGYKYEYLKATIVEDTDVIFLEEDTKLISHCSFKNLGIVLKEVQDEYKYVEIKIEDFLDENFTISNFDIKNTIKPKSKSKKMKI